VSSIGYAMKKKDDHVLVPDLGSLTSVYDRAREHFYYLKGGTIDYGEEHSAQYGHARFEKTYEQGRYLEWDENHPLHFVGHSAGVQVVRILQQMLAEKKFQGHENSSESWVLSVTSLTGALNGTTHVYLDGMLPEDGKTLKPIYLLQLCRVGFIIYDWLDIANLPKEISNYMIQMGARVPNIEPGCFTTENSTKVQASTGFWGGLLLSLLATLSTSMDHQFRHINEGFSIGFTSVLIIVGSIIELRRCTFAQYLF
jgi:hypothetical protein